MREWFEALAPREQVMVGFAGALTVLIVAWLGIWAPLDGGADRLERSVAAHRQTIAQARRLEGRLSAPGAARSTVAGRNQSLVVIVDSTIRERGLAASLRRSQPTGQDSIRLQFENAAFDTLVEWLGDLAGRYGLEVSSASFLNRAEPGRVDSTITLERVR